jgi:2,3-bisphosphoglycerate-independent phosphoglycerate mutase
MSRKKPLVLIIRDGWGIGDKSEGDIIWTGNTQHSKYFEKTSPTTILDPCGEAVGLPAGTMGNSEVGHLNIGAGRVVYQSLTRIDKSIRDGDFFENETLLKAVKIAKEKNSRIHLMGLIQEEGVHAVTRHCHALLEFCKRQNFDNVVVHALTDGRDTPPKSAAKHLEFLDEGFKNTGVGKLATVVGRYYAMDRDNRWDRVKIAYDAIIKGVGTPVKNWKEALDTSYDKGVFDEFVKPYLIDGYEGAGKDDVIIFFNFRTDRTRELTKAIVEKDFKEFETVSHNIWLAGMTHYYDNGNFSAIYPEIKNKNIFGEVLSNAGLKQLRCAETEKFAHVTFFFNDQNNEKFPNETHVLVDSPKVATYDLQPEMSAYLVRDKLLEAVESEEYDVIICNFANGDMVGHTGVPEAIQKAVETVDLCVYELVKAVQKKNGIAILTSDHGNADQIYLSDGSPMTAHSMNPVSFTIVGAGNLHLRKNGSLCDIAPTCLELLGIKQPEEMTGKSLILQS